jgi:hypothetical protein
MSVTTSDATPERGAPSKRLRMLTAACIQKHQAAGTCDHQDAGDHLIRKKQEAVQPAGQHPVYT